MRDISARELKGHNILAVERFRDSTRWMIEFSVRRPSAYGSPAMKCGCFSRRTGIRPPFSVRSAGKSKSSGMLMWSRAMSSTSSQANAATRKPNITTKGKE